jgi:putative oxidoreductase
MAGSVAVRFGGLYRRFAGLAEWLQSPLVLVLRLYWGYQFFQAGRGKLAHIERIAELFANLHIPQPLLSAYLAGITECAGGLLLMVGLAARLVSVPLAVTMIVAYGTAHVDAVRNIFQDPENFISQDPFLFLLTAVVVLAFGPGALSLDGLLARVFGPRSPAGAPAPGRS